MENLYGPDWEKRHDVRVQLLLSQDANAIQAGIDSGVAYRSPDIAALNHLIETGHFTPAKRVS